MMKRLFATLAIAAAALSAHAQTVQINGAGATFPNPIYSKWFSEYHKVHPNVEINYQPIGSGGGIRQISAGTVFFGASDGPMTDEQVQAAGFRILHLPTVLGGVVPVYNVAGVSAPLKFTGPVLADIYLGKITRWNDNAIRNLNAGIELPNDEITVVHRSDGSGTSYIWCDYLSKVSPEYKRRVGVATSVNWPAGVGGKGNDGVAGLVKQTPGAIGYVELIYALQNKISYGSVQNAAGEFVTATTQTVSNAAASAARNMPKDFRVSITNAPGKDVYPISSFTWLLVPESPRDVQRSRIVVDLIRWAITGGQAFAPQLGYAPLPKEVVALELEALKRVRQ
jgi:phosphate transport system substrate-binding protein